MLNPRKTNVALDANALDRDGGEKDALVDRFKPRVASGTVKIVVSRGVCAEVQRPRTPTEVKDAVLPQPFNLRLGLNAAQQAERRRVAFILQGNAKPEKHAADASHEQCQTKCARISRSC